MKESTHLQDQTRGDHTLARRVELLVSYQWSGSKGTREREREREREGEIAHMSTLYNTHTKTSESANEERVLFWLQRGRACQEQRLQANVIDQPASNASRIQSGAH